LSKTYVYACKNIYAINNTRKYILFARKFKYLEIIINILLDNLTSIKVHIKVVNKQIDTMDFI